MKLKDLDNDELLIFYALLLENEKYSNISNLKRAILNRIKTNDLYRLETIMRGLNNE